MTVTLYMLQNVCSTCLVKKKKMMVEKS